MLEYLIVVPLVIVALSIITLVSIVGSIFILFDAPRRGMSRWWALGTLLLWYVVLPIYFGGVGVWANAAKGGGTRENPPTTKRDELHGSDDGLPRGNRQEQGSGDAGRTSTGQTHTYAAMPSAMQQRKKTVPGKKPAATEQNKTQPDIPPAIREMVDDWIWELGFKFASNRHISIRSNAARALGRVRDPRAFDPLIAALNSDDFDDVRGEAALALGKFGDPRAIDPLIAALNRKGNSTAFVRKCAADALGKFKTPRTIDSLIAALKDPNRDVQSHVAGALREIGTPLAVDALIDAMRAKLASTPKPSILDGGDFESELRRITNPQAVDPLLVALKDFRTTRVREIAALALGNIKDPRAIDPLVEALKDEQEDVRAKAAEALGKIKNPRAVDPLIAALKDESWDVRGNVVVALRQIGVPSVWEPWITAVGDSLIFTLENEKSIALLSAAIAARKIKDPRTVGPLISLLQDDRVRNWAIEALGEIKDPRAVDPLIFWLKDPRRFSDSYAARALGKIGDLRAVDALIAARRNEKDIYPLAAHLSSSDAALMGFKSPEMVNSMIAALKSGNEEVQKTAARVLGNIGDSRGVDPLISVLKESKSDAVRFYAAFALGRIGDPRAVDALSEALRDKESDVRGIAAQGLAKIRSPRAVDLLISALKDEKDEVQEVAASTLALIEDPRFSVIDAANNYAALVEKGDRSNDSLLIAAIKVYGHKKMALRYYVRGNESLKRAANAWASSRGYVFCPDPNNLSCKGVLIR